MKKYGYIEDSVGEQDYIFGSERSIKGVFVMPDANWEKYLPKFEYQSKRGLETSNCTNYGTLNALETIFAAKYGIRADFSERYTGVLTGTKPAGNSPHKVIEYIRKYTGLIPEQTLPFSDDITEWEQYYSGVKFAHLLIGLQWLLVWKIEHEWVPGDSQALMDALQFSPLGVAVQAWSRPENDIYVRKGGDNHWCMMFGFRKNRYWLVYDTYDSKIKKLAWDYGFNRVKRYAVDKRAGVDMKTLGRMARGILGAYK